MTRQYYCWKVSLSFRCGCTELAPIVHRCPPDREGCNSWLTNKRTDKYCETHRATWGLAQAQSSSSSSLGGSSGSGSPSGGSRSPSPGPGSEGLGAGVSVGGSAGQAEGEGAPRRRGSPAGGDGVDDGEAGAAVSGRRVVGYY